MGKIFIGIKGEDFIGAGQELRHNDLQRFIHSPKKIITEV